VLRLPSPADLLSELPEPEKNQFLASLSDEECEALLDDWRGFIARPEQIAPEGDWDIWIALAGRGFGKTRMGSEWVREQVEDGCQRIALVGETQRDLEKVMIEGDSGLLSVCPDGFIEKYTKKPVEIIFSTGAKALGYNATEPDQLRGPQFDAAWSDEVAKWRYARETWDQLQFGLRLGDHPRQLATTTPRPIQLIKDILAGKEGKVAVTRGRTSDNRSNLAASFISKIEGRYAGTRLGRQELEGEVLGDLPGALWQQSQIDASRLVEPPELARIVISIDPAVTSGDEADETGITACGQGSADKQKGYLLEDGSMRGRPNEWARRAIALYHKWEADAIVAEVNNGGEMVEETIRAVDPNIRVISVRASRGKHVRAEPISALYEQGRIHHVGGYPELETQLTQFTSAGYEGDDSPDRADAAVWGFSELFPKLVRKTVKPRRRKREGGSWRTA
jgi:phage terminase large subunit-like protein